MFPKSNTKPCYVRSDSKSLEVVEEVISDCSVDRDIDEIKAFLKFTREPWETVIEKWKSCCKERLQLFKKDPFPILAEQWPLLKHSKAVILVNIFNHIFL